MSEASQTVGLIGTGNIGSTLLKSFIQSETIFKENMFAFDTNTELLEKNINELQINKANSIEELIKNTDIIFIAVKPQNVDELFKQVPSDIPNDKLFVSVLAGTPIQFFQKKLGAKAKIIRLMPNTPSLVNAGMIGLSKNSLVSEKESDFIIKMLKPAGELLEIEEKHLDAVTALSGSGPAYIFLIIQAMTNAGMKLGLTQEQSLKLAAQTTYGSAKLVLSTGEHPEVLKDRVSSPAGTTIYALQELEESGLRGTIMRGIEVCYNRSKELKNLD